MSLKYLYVLSHKLLLNVVRPGFCEFSVCAEFWTVKC
jgi:hypothetical protein